MKRKLQINVCIYYKYCYVHHSVQFQVELLSKVLKNYYSSSRKLSHSINLSFTSHGVHLVFSELELWCKRKINYSDRWSLTVPSTRSFLPLQDVHLSSDMKLLFINYPSTEFSMPFTRSILTLS